MPAQRPTDRSPTSPPTHGAAVPGPMADESEIPGLLKPRTPSTRKRPTGARADAGTTPNAPKASPDLDADSPFIEGQAASGADAVTSGERDLVFRDSSHARPPAAVPPVPPVPTGKLDRRGDRRRSSGASPTGLERRRGPGRRLSDFARAAEEGELTREQFLFVVAVDEFKKANGVAFPSWCDVLEVVRLLGYRKVQPSLLTLPRAEDWRERPDTPAQVRTQRQQERDRMARGDAA